MQEHPQQKQPQYHTQQQCAPLRCIPSHVFWVVAGASWVVWAFAVGAAVDDEWMRDNVDGTALAPGDHFVLNACSKLDESHEELEEILGDVEGLDEAKEKQTEACDTFVAFTAMQCIATIVCSISVLLLSLAFFRPFAGGGLSSARSLAITGGGLMVAYAVFQLVAVALFVAFERTNAQIADEYANAFASAGYDVQYNESYESELGPSFAVGVCGLILGTTEAVLLLVFARVAGDGPLYPCCHSLMLANEENGGGLGGGQGAGGGKPAAAPGQGQGPAPPPPAYGSA